MRASGPYEVKPRQLRALVLLLALLPLLPMTFVVRFLIEGVANERLEALERARPVYQRFLEATSGALAGSITRQLAPDSAQTDPWVLLKQSPGAADSFLTMSGEGKLSLPAASGDTGRGSLAAEALAKAVLDGGTRYATTPPTGAVRWRFLTETPEAVFSLLPHGSAERRSTGQAAPILLKTRQHLVDQITSFYQRELDPQTALRLVDESQVSLPLVGPKEAGETGADLLGETSLPPPLPAWRIRLYTADASLVSGLAREQLIFYWWSVGGMVAATALIAGVAGWALTRRIALHELSNDALGIVSHEMKTPLASIRLLIETLLDHREQGGRAATEEYLRLIAGENARLENLVESFQTLTRLDQPRGGRGRLRLEPVRAGDIAEAASARLSGRLEAEKCTFTLEGDLDAPPFPGDREALTATLVNLLDNALKYSGETKNIQLRVNDKPDRVLFEVRDDGIGIASEEQGKIFERFYQADNRLSRTHEGCGLGLSIVRSAVKAHGGSISVQSAPGKGSTFTVCIPKRTGARRTPGG